MTRRDQQQLLVAELGRAALTGATVPELAASAVDTVAEGLNALRVALFERQADSLVATAAQGWSVGETCALDADSPIARAYREADSTITETMAVAPVRGEGGGLAGVFAAVSAEPVVPDDVVFLRSVANLVAAAMVRERAESRLAFLAEAGRLLGESLEYDVTLSTLADLVVPRLADWCIVDLVEDDGTLQRVAVRAADRGKQALLDALHREYPPVAGSGQPAAQALAHSAPVQFSEFTPESLRATTLDDRHFELMTQLDPRSAMAVPLIAHGRVLGALTFAWSESGRRYDHSDTVLAEELGHRAALAIENARLYRSELEAQRRIAFLVEASDVLASSLDYDETLTALARLAVPRLGDWCVIYIVGPGGVIERRAVEHAGGRQDFIRSVLEAHPIRPDAPVGVPAVIRTGRSELEAVASPISTASDVEDPEELASALGEIAVRSTMCVPLIARRRTIGAILFVSAESRRVFAESDLRLAEELAARAAVAVDNSRLFNEAEQRAEAAEALDSIADGVFLVDTGGIVRIWNAGAEAITGIPSAEVRGRSPGTVFDGWDEIAAVADATPRTVPATVDGRELWLSISGVPSSDGMAYAFRDVTADRQLDRLKSDFVATVSHELRTPLAAVYGAAVTLAERDFTDREGLRRDLVTQIAEQAARLSAIVDDILFVGRLEAGGLRLEPATVDVVDVARAAVEAARIRAAGIEVTLRAVAESSTIETDAGRLRQVLDNLLDNAIKYSPNRGPVELRVEDDERWTRLAVRDHGVGIPAGELARIFEKFYRLDPHQTRGVNGTGLGLYVCRELVERMDGRINVTSLPGRGSTFVVELPRR
ncbi:MAG TPA: ATP-binding protein [Gaiellaceae bacterium]|nr:ATP-binding protein [Gaiellaceae bacterium]